MKLKSFAILITWGFLAACGDDKGQKVIVLKEEAEKPEGEYIAVVDQPDSKDCSKENEGEIVFASSDQQAYTCRGQVWMSPEEEKVSQLKAQLLGDWHAPCHAYADDSGALEFKISFREDGVIESGTVQYDLSNCNPKVKLTDHYRSGLYELLDSSVLSLEHALFVSRSYKTQMYFADGFLYIGQPHVSASTSDQEPYRENFIKFERADFPVNRTGRKIFFEYDPNTTPAGFTL